MMMETLRLASAINFTPAGFLATPTFTLSIEGDGQWALYIRGQPNISLFNTTMITTGYFTNPVRDSFKLTD